MSRIDALPTPFVDLGAAFASGVQTPRGVLDRCLAVYAAREKDVRAFVSVDFDGARAAADAATARWRARTPLSRIDGMPVGIKDVIETVDMPTGMGSRYFDGWQANRDGATVSALREAGAVILGKTVTTEFAATVPGPTRNPHDLQRTPGGSSSGSAAAVGAGMLIGALGTQVVGSIIRPAGYCGCWGYKPSVGGLNRGGSHDYMSQSCAGIIAATRADTWQIAREIVVRVGGDPGHAGIAGPEVAPAAIAPAAIAVLQTPGWRNANPQAIAAFENVVQRLQARGITIVTRQTNAALDAVEEALEEAFALTRAINAWESRWPLNTYAHTDAAKLSAEMMSRLREAQEMTLDDYRAALLRREEIRARHAALADIAPLCLSLTAPDIAPMGLESTGDPSFAVPASLLGVPALAMPWLTVQGLPLGVQAIGFAGRDADLFAAAAALERMVAPGAKEKQEGALM